MRFLRNDDVPPAFIIDCPRDREEPESRPAAPPPPELADEPAREEPVEHRVIILEI